MCADRPKQRTVTNAGQLPRHRAHIKLPRPRIEGLRPAILARSVCSAQLLVNAEQLSTSTTVDDWPEPSSDTSQYATRKRRTSRTSIVLRPNSNARLRADDASRDGHRRTWSTSRQVDLRAHSTDVHVSSRVSRSPAMCPAHERLGGAGAGSKSLGRRPRPG